jgi:dihydrodipicolinate reductase
MGRALIECAARDPELVVSAEIDAGDDFASALVNCDAVIDFTHATATAEIAAACANAGKPLVIGTTGHDDDQRAAIVSVTDRIPLVFAPNFSIGVNTLFWLTQKAAEILGPDFDLEVVEMHHRLKKDAPSGTARRLAEILAEVRGLSYANDVRHGREGMVGERTHAEIGMHSIRGGDVVGDHTVIFANVGERVELTHKASSRDTFANGALRAAKWTLQQPPGLYDMQDVLGLR